MPPSSLYIGVVKVGAGAFPELNYQTSLLNLRILDSALTRTFCIKRTKCYFYTLKKNKKNCGASRSPPVELERSPDLLAAAKWEKKKEKRGEGGKGGEKGRGKGREKRERRAK